MTDEERAQIGIEPATGTQVATSEILQEREIVRILLNYGAELAVWEGDGDVPIAPYLLNAIDDITFEDKASAFIVEVFRKKAEDFEIPEAKFFFSHEDSTVQDLAISCVSSPYELSPNWNDDKRKIYVTREHEHLKALTTQAIYRIKNGRWKVR